MDRIVATVLRGGFTYKTVGSTTLKRHLSVRSAEGQMVLSLRL